MLRSDLCDFSGAYIVVKGDITLTNDAGRDFIDERHRLLAFKNNAPFTSCISKINNILIDNTGYLHVVLPMYNLNKYSKNYRKTTGSLWNYYRDQPIDIPANNYNVNPIGISESFIYKSIITGKTSNANQENEENTEQVNTKTKKNLEIVVKLSFH